VLDARVRMEARLLWASLWKRRGRAGLAALAVAIGASVAAALLHVSGDVGVKLSRELRAFGPNLIVAPAAASGERTLDERQVRARCEAVGVSGVPVLYANSIAGGHGVPIAGADLRALATLHPSWKWSGAGPQTSPAAAPANEAYALPSRESTPRSHSQTCLCGKPRFQGVALIGCCYRICHQRRSPHQRKRHG